MKKFLFLLLILSAAVISCEEESNPEFDSDNFFSIFDNNNFGSSNDPIDMKQTSDGGYLILGTRKLEESSFNGIYLLRVDQYGDFVRETLVDKQYVNPISGLTEIDGQFYFFCMDELNVQAYLGVINPSANEAVTFISVSGLTYPMASSFVDGNFAVLGYNNVDKETTVSVVTPSGSIANQVRYTIGVGNTDNLDKQITNHFLRNGRKLPFAVGKVGNQYYFNGFYDFTFSMLFTNLNQEVPEGGIQGQREDENSGLSAIHPLGGNKFAISWFNFGENFFLPSATIASSGTPSSIATLEASGLPFRELVKNAKVKVVSMEVGAKQSLIFGSTTLSQQIGLFFYDQSTGKFMSSRYLGFSNPFEIASLLPTADGGLAVCGTTFLAGRFPRICIIKISKEELSTNSR